MGEGGQKAIHLEFIYDFYLSTVCDLGRCWTLELVEGQLKVGISTTASVSHHPYWRESSHWYYHLGASHTSIRKPNRLTSSPSMALRNRPLLSVVEPYLG